MNSEAERQKPWAPAIATLFTFLALGPPLGAMTFVLWITVAPSLGFLSVPGDKSVIDVGVGFAVMLFAIPLSYLLGGIQAGLTGLLLALYGSFRGRPGFWVVVAVTVLVLALSYATNFGGLFPDSQQIHNSLLIAQIVATLLCWLIVRTFWRAA